MWNIIKTILISLVSIVILHYTYNYMKTHFSYKKTKDLVGIQTEKYKDILSEVLEKKKNNSDMNVKDYLPLEDKVTMEKILINHMNNEIENL